MNGDRCGLKQEKHSSALRTLCRYQFPGSGQGLDGRLAGSETGAPIDGYAGELGEHIAFSLVTLLRLIPQLRDTAALRLQCTASRQARACVLCCAIFELVLKYYLTLL